MSLIFQCPISSPQKCSKDLDPLPPSKSFENTNLKYVWKGCITLWWLMTEHGISFRNNCKCWMLGFLRARSLFPKGVPKLYNLELWIGNFWSFNLFLKIFGFKVLYKQLFHLYWEVSWLTVFEYGYFFVLGLYFIMLSHHLPYILWIKQRLCCSISIRNLQYFYCFSPSLTAQIITLHSC